MSRDTNDALNVKLTGIHNRVAKEAVRLIMEETIKAGGRETDVMLILESVASGVILTLASFSGRDPGQISEVFMMSLPERMAEVSNKNPKLKGTR